MKRAFILALLILSCLSCIQERKKNTTDCEIDYEFRANFLNCISIICLHESKYLIDEKNKLKAYQALSVLTGIELTDQEFYHQLLKNDDIMNTYLDAWRNWYQSNKCTYTQKDALKEFYQKTLERRNRILESYINEEKYMKSNEYKEYMKKNLIEFPDFFPERLKI